MVDAAKQPLIEFITNILSDMDSGVLTAHEALAAGSQYGHVRELLDVQADQFSQAELLGDEAFAQAVRGVFQGAFTQLEGLANFQNQPPDMATPEQSIRAVATLREAAVDRIKKGGAAKLAPYQDRRRAFIHALVEKYSTKEKIIHAAVLQAETAQTNDGFTNSLVSALGNDALGTIQTALKNNREYVAAATSAARSQKEMLGIVFTNLNIARPDVLVDVLLNRPSNESSENTRLRAIKLAGVAADLETNAGPFLTSRGFFTPGGARGVTTGAQAAASGILSLIAEPLREIIIKEKVSGSLRAMFSNTQGLIDRLGESFVQSNVFARVTASLNRSLGDKSTSSQAKGVFDDVFSTIFRGPLSNASAAGSRERVFNFFELARANASAPKGFEFLHPNALPWNIYADAAKAAKQTMGAAASGGRTSARPWMPLVGLGSFGSWIGNTVASGFDRSLTFFMSSPRVSTELSRSRRAAAIPTPIWAEMPGLVAIIVVVTILLLFVLPSPLNGPLLNYSAKVSALLASLSESDQASTTTNDNGWPVQCGCISQGPNEGTHAMSSLNAIDFLFGSCDPTVHIEEFATENGTVTTVSQQYGVGERCVFANGSWDCGGKSTYGNFLIIHTDSGQDLLYGHLASFNVSEGQKVAKGQSVGISDDNGVTTVEHLHFEVLGSSSDNAPLNQSNKVTPEPGTNGLCVSV